MQVLTAPLQVYNIDGKFREVADVLNWLTTGYWFLDVPASFLTAVYINDILHTRLADVARVYLKGWFWCLGELGDLVRGTPLEDSVTPTQWHSHYPLS